MTAVKPGKQTVRGRLRSVPEPGREPPHNLEAEEAVLGAVLASGRLPDEVTALVEEADFYRPAHRAIWRAMLRLADRAQPTDPVTVLGELDDRGELADIGGGPFSAHPGPSGAHGGQCRPLRPAGRRHRPPAAGDRPGHPGRPL